jgi:hypothetical protein
MSSSRPDPDSATRVRIRRFRAERISLLIRLFPLPINHSGLLEVGAPYVYHVVSRFKFPCNSAIPADSRQLFQRKRDLAHFEEAVTAAMERTIDPYIRRSIMPGSEP